MFVVVGLGILDVENAVDIWPRVSIDTDVELISNAAPETIIRTVLTRGVGRCFCKGVLTYKFRGSPGKCWHSTFPEINSEQIWYKKYHYQNLPK